MRFKKLAIICVFPLLSVAAFAQVFTDTASLHHGHAYSTATLVDNGGSIGTVLVVGGYNADGTVVTGAEIYTANYQTWTDNPHNTNHGHAMHTATYIPTSGKIIVVGGVNNNGQVILNAELWDPGTDRFTDTGSPHHGHSQHTAVWIPTIGKVLICGGVSSGSTITQTAELYDPGTGTFTDTGSLQYAHRAFTATWIPAIGMVLIAGGFDASGSPSTAAELYNPVSGTFSVTGSLHHAHAYHTAALLPSTGSQGTVLVNSGFDIGGGATQHVSRYAELYDPVSGTFSDTGSLHHDHAVGAATYIPTLLPAGKVLVNSGYNSDLSASEFAELYDPTTFMWTDTASLDHGHSAGTAVWIPSGVNKVLVNSGYDVNGSVTQAAALYTP
ncbi:MAG TPA: hypothetical protein VGD64_04780 [Acidisarcina sp.]